MKKQCYHILMPLLLLAQTSFAQLKNFDSSGHKMIRFSKTGDAIDAHDGEIAQFNGVYYLYGTSYDCGFQWGDKSAPFCGFKVYTSNDLHTWTDRGFLFDASTPVWQTRCDGKTYGCFRPHVIYNRKTKLYVLWINVYDNVVGYRVFTSRKPTGPFKETAEPKLAVNSTMPAAGLNNGDHDTFVDDDGQAYLAYTDWRSNGAIVIEKLSDDYLTGSGKFVKAVTTGSTEAPGLFKRNGRYYVVYSDPNCGYCSGTGTSYRTAASPLGPWSAGKKISDNSCGGQPSFVSVVRINKQVVYLYGSDLWNNAAKNEALADYFWAPLTFAADGSIEPLQCTTTYRLPKAGTMAAPAQLDVSSGQEGFHPVGDIRDSTVRAQSFMTGRDGVLAKLRITLFKLDNPGQGLNIGIYKANDEGIPTGDALYTYIVPAASIGWSPKQTALAPKIPVTKGARYAIVLQTSAGKGAYGVVMKNANAAHLQSAISKDQGQTFTADHTAVLRFETFITGTTSAL